MFSKKTFLFSSFFSFVGGVGGRIWGFTRFVRRFRLLCRFSVFSWRRFFFFALLVFYRKGFC